MRRDVSKPSAHVCTQSGCCTQLAVASVKYLVNQQKVVVSELMQTRRGAQTRRAGTNDEHANLWVREVDASMHGCVQVRACDSV